MVKIELEESWAISMLSILHISIGIEPDSYSEYKRLYASIAEQIGQEKMFHLMQSDEYINLANANVDYYNKINESRHRLKDAYL